MKRENKETGYVVYTFRKKYHDVSIQIFYAIYHILFVWNTLLIEFCVLGLGTYGLPYVKFNFEPETAHHLSGGIFNCVQTEEVSGVRHGVVL